MSEFRGGREDALRLTGFVDGESVREEGDEEVTDRPVLDICTQQIPSASPQSPAYRNSPSSRITLSPNTVISNLPVASSRERMFRIGFERALRSIAATPACSRPGVSSWQLPRERFGRTQTDQGFSWRSRRGWRCGRDWWGSRHAGGGGAASQEVQERIR